MRYIAMLLLITTSFSCTKDNEFCRIESIAHRPGLGRDTLYYVYHSDNTVDYAFNGDFKVKFVYKDSKLVQRISTNNGMLWQSDSIWYNVSGNLEGLSVRRFYLSAIDFTKTNFKYSNGKLTSIKSIRQTSSSSDFSVANYYWTGNNITAIEFPDLPMRAELKHSTDPNPFYNSGFSILLMDLNQFGAFSPLRIATVLSQDLLTHGETSGLQNIPLIVRVVKNPNGTVQSFETQPGDEVTFYTYSCNKD